MNTEKKILCGKCRKKVSYQILKRPTKVMIQDVEIQYEEYYCVCNECKTEIFAPGLDDRNVELVDKMYRKKRIEENS